MFEHLDRVMLCWMKDSAHDREHVRRVLYTAMRIARTEEKADADVLIAACLLHDTGRADEAKDPEIRHEEAGAARAYECLLAENWPEEKAAHVRDCILAHRFRSGRPPVSLEAKILFDADKLDAAGAMGIARTFLYAGNSGEPIYSVGPDGKVLDGSGDEEPSFFHEYQFKLKNLYGRFYTAEGRRLAGERRAAARVFYQSLLGEARSCYDGGEEALAVLLRGD